MEERQQLQYKIIDMESRLRAATKHLGDQEREYDRCTKEKYDAQNKQFLLQQEMNQHSNKQFDLLWSNNQNGFEVQKKMMDHQNAVSPQTYVYDRIRGAASNPGAGPQEPTRALPPLQDSDLDHSYAGNKQRAASRGHNSFINDE